MPFGEPEETGGLRLNPKDIINHLLMVWSCDYIAHSPTQFTQPGKPSDVIVVDVVDLDQMGADGQPGLLAVRCWWRQAQLIQSLKPRIGKPDPVLARMGRGTASMGKAAPYQLISATADGQAVRLATSWLEAHPEFTPGNPTPAPTRSFEQPTVWTPGPGQSHWDEPESSYMKRPNLPPAQPETALERMARLAQEQRNHRGEPQSDTPPY
jgi:hypothetical protein